MSCHRNFAAITDADRRLEQDLKERLDAITYRASFFRDCDEPNETFAPRAMRERPALRPLIAALPIWPNGFPPRHQPLST